MRLMGECPHRSLWRGSPWSQITVGEPQPCPADVHDLAPPQERHQLGRIVVAGDPVGRSELSEKVQHEGLSPIAKMEDPLDTRAVQTFDKPRRQAPSEAGQMGIRDDADPQCVLSASRSAPRAPGGSAGSQLR